MQGFDRIDQKLINMLQSNARCSIKQLAEQVFMSPPAVTARIARLEKSGAITGYHTHIDLQKFGYNVIAFVNLKLEPTDRQKFVKEIAANVNVMECCNVTGDYSMLIKACFHNTKELDSFVGELQKYGKTYTQIVLSSIVGPKEPNLEA